MTTENQTADRPETELSAVTAKWLGPVFGAVFWIVVLALSSDTFRDVFLQRWWAFAIVLAIVVMIVALVPAGRRVLAAAPTTRAALFFFLVVPLLVVLVGGVTLMADEKSVMVVRGVFLIVVCVLPAMMWYLFIVTRKASLFNDFLANLDRLGLLQQADGETEASKERRVESYLQKFEAIYGDLRDEIHEEVLSNRLVHYSRADAAGAMTLSTATFPVAVSTVLIAIGWLITLRPNGLGSTNAPTWGQVFQPTVTPVTLAFLGAYFFSLQMLFRRYVLKDLGGTAYVAVSIRIILAIIGIWTLAALGSKIFSDGQTSDQHNFISWENQLLLMGFVLGVFPRVLWQIIQSLFARVARFAVPSMMSQLPVSDLDGLTVWHEARLEEEDIENIPNMANADLVELLLSTRFPPERIIDWADQAILYTQLGPQQDENARHKLRTHGIRTATSLLWTSAEASRQNRAAFEKILTDPNGDSVMPTLEASLATNSNLKLILRWRGVLDTPSRSSTQMQAGQLGTAHTVSSPAAA